jgi:formylglycine-generating enzyme required for sulfatase activity
VLVVAHSHSGRTAAAAREIARILRARAVILPGAPGEDRAGDGAPPKIDLSGVKLLFIGFPVWDEGPSPQIQALAAGLKLGGIAVVPFYTFLHYAAPKRLEAFNSLLVRRGAEVRPPLVLRIPLNLSQREIMLAARSALLARTDLWWGREQRGIVPECRRVGAAEACRVPGGNALVEIPEVRDGLIGESGPVLMKVLPFWMDRGEVTVEAYGACVRAGACPPVTVEGICGALLSGSGSLPVPCADSSAAEKYCRWSGGRLPTQAEWTRAARGDTADPYPWGRDPPVTGMHVASGLEGAGRLEHHIVPADGGVPVDRFRGLKGLAAPCSHEKGNSRWGICDLAGSLAEWVAPSSPAVAGWALLAGGGWLDGSPEALTVSSLMIFRAPGPGFYLSGFRCARGGL